jgi:hypothetical protein
MSNDVSVEFSRPLEVPPRFGETVKLSVGGPLMVVVDADTLPADCSETCLVTVMYADDMQQVHSMMVPWGLLCTWSAAALVSSSAADEQEENANFISARAAFAQADMSARIAVLCDELRKSRDPASFFGLLRSSIVELLQSAAAELELPQVEVSSSARVAPEFSGIYVAEPSDEPLVRGTYVPDGCLYVSPGVVRNSDGNELSVGIATVNDHDGSEQMFVPYTHF